jgi:L-asparaginase
MSTKVLMLALGGTIASTAEPERGLIPQLDGPEVAALARPIHGIEVQAQTVASIPGASITIPTLARAHEAAVGWLAGDPKSRRGVVITTGTDTLEEVAFLLDLHWGSDATVVVTGAMRAPGQSSDASRNLEAAVRVAASGSSSKRGVLVVMHNRIYDASTVTKAHSTAVNAFRSTARSIGSVVEERVQFHSEQVRHPAIAPDFAAWKSTDPPWVPIVTPTLADPPRMVATCLDAQADGLVLAAWGVGHVPGRWVPEVARAAARLPVALTTGTGAGSVATGIYGFPGSESSLIDAGVLPAGYLTPRKARALVSTALVLGIGEDGIRVELAARGRRPRTDLRGHA